MHSKKLWREESGNGASGNSEIAFLGITCCESEQMFHHKIDLGMQRHYTRSMEEVNGTLLLFRGASCDQLRRETDAFVVEAK